MALKLPTSKTPPVQDLGASSVLLYGGTKLGKSTMCAGIPDHLFLSTEKGLNHLLTNKLEIQSWEEMLAACALLAKPGHGINTVIIDTIDNANLLCQDYICSRHGWKHPGEPAHGKGWGLCNGEFRRVITKLSMLRMGLVMVSHAKEITIESRKGEYQKTVPTLTGQSSNFVEGLVDFQFYVQQKKDGARVMRTKSSPFFSAGDRTGKLPDELPLSWASFVEAWEATKAEKPSITEVKRA